MFALVLLAIVPLIGGLLAWFALGGNITSVEQNLEGISGGILAAPVKVAVNAWVEVAVISAGLGIGIWLLESKIAKGQGFDVAPPPLAPISLPAPPTFAPSGGIGFQAGPVSVSQGLQPAGGGGGGGGAASFATRSPRAAARQSLTDQAVALQRERDQQRRQDQQRAEQRRTQEQARQQQAAERQRQEQTRREQERARAQAQREQDERRHRQALELERVRAQSRRRP